MEDNKLKRPLTRHVGCGWMTETERFLVDRLLETELAGSSACKSKNTEIKIAGLPACKPEI